MMEQGRGSSVIWEKGVTQNGNIWVPSTPGKSVLQCSSNARSDIQQTQRGGENWHDLIDVYEDFLRNKQPHSFDLNKSEGLIYSEHNHEDIPTTNNYSRVQQNLSPNCQDVSPVEVYSSPPLNFTPNSCAEVNNLEQNVGIVHNLRILNQNAGKIGTYAQNLGQVVPPQEVNSFSELMSMVNAKRSHPSIESHTLLEGYPTITCPVSQVESNQVAYASAGMRVQQTHILHGGAGFPQSDVFYGDHDGGGYNQQEILNSGPSVAKDTLNLTPRSEARESSSTARSSTLGPVTPDQQKHSKTPGIVQVPHLLINSTSTPEKYIHGSVVLSSESEVIEKENGDILASSTGTSTASISTSVQGMRRSDGGNGGIDLNKTPQQKTPKRTKHRPKVVVEGKPKRTPKPAATKSNTPDGTPPLKRKNVQKIDTKNSTSPVTDTVKVVETSDMGPAKKSSKRKLNFDMDSGAKKRAEKEGQGQIRQVDQQDQNNERFKLPLELDSNGPSTSAAKAGHYDTYDKERQQTQTSYTFVHSINKIHPQESMPLETTTPSPTFRDQNLNALARSFSMNNSSICQSNGENRYNQAHHHTRGGFSHPVFQANTYEHNLGLGAHSSVQTAPRVQGHLMDVTDKQGIKRAYEHTVIGSSQHIAMMGLQRQSCGAPEWQTGSETFKKNFEDKFYGTSYNMLSGYTTVEEFVRQVASGRNKSFLAQSSTETHNGELRNSDCRRQMINIYPNDNSTNVICHGYMNNPYISHKFQQQHASSQVHLCSERMLPKSSHNSADAQFTKSVNAVAVINRNMESASNRNPQPIPVNGSINYPHHVVVKKRTAGLTTYKKVPVVDKVLQQEPRNKRSYGNPSLKVTGTRVDKKDIASIDYITDGMKELCITDNGKELFWKNQSALVPYKGDGAIVPHEEFDLVKKKNPRPRVDLDPETNRLWNLLMGKEGGESAETLDTHKEKWWEEERKVFRGRVDSFIARMHLVQGDRRFSKWKGSVVDSVIGVFLTQNVSDHLSSSAFMSLAAKFPSKSAREQCCERGGSPSAGNSEVRITYPDGTTFRQKILREPVYGSGSVTSTETSENRTDNVIPEKETYLVNDHIRRTEEDIISSQSSSESLVLQAPEDVRSSSGSNSEAECGWNISKNVGHISVPQQDERLVALQQNKFQLRESSYLNKTHHQQFEKPAYRQSPGWVDISKVQHHQSSVQNWESDGIAFLGKESISTLTSKDSKGTGAQCMDDYRGQTAESAFTISEDGSSKFQTSSVKNIILEKSIELQNDSLDEAYNRNHQYFIKNMSEKHGVIDRQGTTEDFSKQSNGNRKQTEVITDMGQDQSYDKLSSKISVKTSNARKGKAEPINWDTLRKQVHSKAGTTGRNRDAMDSLDYEAMINADVHEISETIKERGMNNMLAERMKSFLHRLVEDHERIDLEWLRDVQPDKAKDYLLSIRGLGLKSVECIRLLTLHHLAFPVDTNVGRIAVRLGWVPLQPLPESLQLHLLELYPILESIQKYLWPRLCKLDQETLYELHYQMITFGKVFCTKRDPNCNACPMRGECRHFASAFASARLALPGLQERHIVSSAAPKRANNRSDVIIKPMSLPPLEDSIDQGVRLSRDCEPLIEEPTTPEPPAEVEERDIEDAFYEDPDEIPVIKLNIEEFTTNLQSFIQGQIQIGEGDMSRALVALNPNLASIPTPKLKHISRLRTEHQVYELPDSHSLLKGMDRREPDDPTPYLLAIWTPGETADSIQPPESKCSYLEGGGGLCNNETCFSCNSTREAHAQTVRGTILIPCRTAMRGSFPLNGTYFQVNEVFADHESSLNPIDVPRSLLWNLRRRTVFFGSSVSSIFKGLSTEDIQFCFWKGFVCVRGFEQKTRAPRPLRARLHFIASKMAKRNEENIK